MNEEIVCLWALTLLDGVGHLTARRLYDIVGSAEALFSDPQALKGLNPRFVRRIQNAIASGKIVEEARITLQRALDKGLQLIPISSKEYPYRLRECVDAPLVLFAKGNMDALKSPVIVSVVGTRKADRYGKDITALLLKQLQEAIGTFTVVSGLAYGIDIAAHKAALELGLPTLGVLGHGLDRIYPAVHRHTAIEMLEKGGLITEYELGTSPDRYHFVNRNRIVAGISDATLVVQSAKKGGSLITANLAFQYDRNVFSVPGKITDSLSEGCNLLIANNVAFPAISGEAMAQAANWTLCNSEAQPPVAEPQTLDFDSDPETLMIQKVYQLIAEEEGVMIEDLCYRLGLSIQDASLCLFNLEMQGVVQTAPGGLYIPKIQ